MTSGEKRRVATDALEVLGLPDLGGRDVGRDAIHLAVEPAVAGHWLAPGQKIVRARDGRWEASAGRPHMAIVDPFLDATGVPEHGRFLAIIPPRQITSLRHVWSHPDFPEEGATGGVSDELESSPAMFATPAERLSQAKDELPSDTVFVGRPVSRLEAKRRLEDFSHRIRSSYEELLEMIRDGRGYTNTGDSDSAYEGMIDDYQAVTGSRPSIKDEDLYFSCSC